MDVKLYFRVTWRFRYIVAGGLLLATALAFLSLVRVDLTHGTLKYRSAEKWQSSAQLLITQPNFPLGKSSVQLGSDERLAGLATIYANLASSDPIRRLILADGPLQPHDMVQAFPVTSPVDNNLILPLVEIDGIAASPERAPILAQRATDAIRKYVTEHQRASGIPENDRVVVQEIKRPLAASLLQGRSKTLPIVVFLTVMAAVFGLVFMLENLRPRIRPVSRQGELRSAHVSNERVSSRSA
jgi:hypothetical protein